MVLGIFIKSLREKKRDYMSTIIFIIILLISLFLGIFGWSQIVGGFQNLKSRGPRMLITIAIWTAILGGSFYIVYSYFYSNLWAWIIGIVISFILVLRSGKIE